MYHWRRTRKVSTHTTLPLPPPSPLRIRRADAFFFTWSHFPRDFPLSFLVSIPILACLGILHAGVLHIPIDRLRDAGVIIYDRLATPVCGSMMLGDSSAPSCLRTKNNDLASEGLASCLLLNACATSLRQPWATV